MKSLISLIFLLACFHSQKTFAQDLILKECLDSDSVKECSQQKILEILSDKYNHTNYSSYAAKFTLNDKGKFSTYLSYLFVEYSEDIIKGLKKVLKKLDPSCYGKTYTVKYEIDRNSNFRIAENFPPYPLIGEKLFNTMMIDSFEVPDIFKESGISYNSIMRASVDTNGYLIDGTEKILNAYNSDYRISDASLDLFKKLLKVKFEPSMKNGKKREGLVSLTLNRTAVYGIKDREIKIELFSGVGPYYPKGVKYFEEEKYKEAIESFSHALRIDEGHLDARYNRAATYFKLGNTEKACADWKKAALLGDEGSAGLFESNCASEIK